jgi:hypothetical protein
MVQAASALELAVDALNQPIRRSDRAVTGTVFSAPDRSFSLPLTLPPLMLASVLWASFTKRRV